MPQILPLFRVQGTTYYRDEAYNKLRPTVYIAVEHEVDAKVIAILRFKDEILEREQYFEHLASMTPERIEREFNSDVSLKALYMAACGQVTVQKLPYNFSDVVYD